MNNILLLFSNCMLVKGKERSSICDLQREAIYLIPNDFYNLFCLNSYINTTEVFSGLSIENHEILNEYFQFLIKNELAFYCNESEINHFPPLSTDFLFPAKISNCILDLNTQSDYINQNLFIQLIGLGCKFIQLRIFRNSSIFEIESYLDLITDAPIKSVELIMPYNEALGSEQIIVNLVEKYNKISNFTVYNADKNSIIKEGFEGLGWAFKITNNITSEFHCGIIEKSMFSINIPTFTESLSHNTCLNRKISIDTEGNIKNCPSMKESFGNIKDTTLQEAIERPGFKKYWNITKDQIAVCKDCEFRHVCTDCRAYLEIPEDDYSKPLKCGYNPYTCEWEEWSTNPLKQKAIDYYGMREIMKNEE